MTCVARAEVPALVLDDGRIIADSTIISEYIDEVYPEPPLHPKEPYERARMRIIETSVTAAWMRLDSASGSLSYVRKHRNLKR